MALLRKSWRAKLGLFLPRELSVLLPSQGVDEERQREEISLVSHLVTRLLEQHGDLTRGEKAKEELEAFLGEDTVQFCSELMLFLRGPWSTLAAFDKLLYTEDGRRPPEEENEDTQGEGRGGEGEGSEDGRRREGREDEEDEEDEEEEERRDLEEEEEDL